MSLGLLWIIWVVVLFILVIWGGTGANVSDVVFILGFLFLPWLILGGPALIIYSLVKLWPVLW